MKSMETKERFIELRAQGHSFDRIASEIDASKPTLIKWHREFEKEIANLKFLHFERLMEQYGLMKQQKVEALGELLDRAMKELKDRDLSDVPTKHLLKMIVSLQGQLDSELAQVKCRTERTGRDPIDAMLDDMMWDTIALGE